MSDGAAVVPALPTPEPPPARRRSSLELRTAVLLASVAAIVVVVAGVIAFPLVQAAAETQAQQALAQQADLLADLVSRQISGEPVPRDQMPVRVIRSLQADQIEVVATGPGRTPLFPVTEADAAVLAAGGSISDIRPSLDGDGRVFVEGRPLPGQQGVVLIQSVRVSRDQAWVLLGRLAVALVLGLAIAVVVGLLAARRVTRPLREAAGAAERLTAGERDVRLEPDGPAEVADLADSLTRRAGALARSENRQREFLLSVSHELRTPLTGITGYAEALADGVVTGDDVPRTGGIMLTEAHRLERLVSDLLDLSRAGADDLRLDVRPVDLSAFAAAAGTVWGDRCTREGVVFRLEPPAVPAIVVTDPLRLRQIVDNLAENALRVTPAGAPMVIAVGVSGTDAVVQVRDGGPGLTPDDVAVAFQPAALYARYRGVRRVGTGVGLALVGRLAARLGGRAEAGRAPEGGASFTVRLPLAPAPPTLSP